MIIDNKGKLFGKISIVDICVLLVVIVGLAGAFFAVSTLKSGKLDDNSKLALNSSEPMQDAVVSLEIKGVRSMTRDALKEGDEVYTTSSEEGDFLGIINHVEYEPAVTEMVADDGAIYMAEIPNKYDVTILLDVKGKNTQTGFYTESEVELLYGKNIEIKTSTVKTMPQVVGIEIK